MTMSKKTDTYVFDIDAEVQAFYAACPEHRYGVFFVEMNEQQNRVVHDAREVPRIERMMKHDGVLMGWLRNYSDQRQPFAAHRPAYTCIALHGDARIGNCGLPRLTGLGSNSNVEAVFAMDHEIGHYMARDFFGLTDKNLRECQADSFAALRHFQRFGMDSNIPSKIAEMRGLGLVCRTDKGVHFTSRSIQAAIKAAKSQDIMSLTIDETATLAFDIAEKFYLGSKKTSALSEQFNFVAGHWPDIAAADPGYVKVLKDIAANNNHNTVGKWAKTVLKLAKQR